MVIVNGIVKCNQRERHKLCCLYAGFHLHLIVIEAAENGLSRQLWYYGVSYGSPAIVVLLSFLLDPRSYRSENYCWVQTSFTLFCFVGPAVLVALVSKVAYQQSI